MLMLLVIIYRGNYSPFRCSHCVSCVVESMMYTSLYTGIPVLVNNNATIK